MKRKVLISFIIGLAILIFFSNYSNAATELSEINNKYFYIKNAFTGHYLDVSGGTAQPGTNVQQYEFNKSNAQIWYIEHIGNGEYMLFSKVGNTVNNGTTYLYYALDVDNGINANGTQIHIRNGVANGITQTYSFTKTVNNTYIIWTKASNYTKVVSLSDNLCSNRNKYSSMGIFKSFS